MPEAAPAPIALDDVVLSYGPHRVLDRLSLTVPAASVYALLGGNGAGKSTTLSVLLGFAKPERGRARIAEIDPAASSNEARRRIAYLPENVALYEHLSAVENADYLLALSGAPRARGELGKAIDSPRLEEHAGDQPRGGL